MNVARIHILVVDDLVDAADSTIELLSIWGYEAIACYSAEAAIECALNRRPDAVLLDLAMPHMDGFQFAGLFQKLPECGTVPLIALSGYSSHAYRAKAREVGIRHYLLKPADPTCLKVLLKRETATTAAPLSFCVQTVRNLVVDFPRPRKRNLLGETPSHVIG
jgi:CheY-like chemotaxis protein